MRKSKRRDAAFSLIEILLVITIIAVLATLGLTVSGSMTRKKIVSRTSAELQEIATAIDNFKLQFGYYPRDNPGNSRVHSLYYELTGVDYIPDDPLTGQNEERFVTVERRSTMSAAEAGYVFGNPGFDNARQAGAPAIKNVLQPRPKQLGQISTNPFATNAFVIELLVAPGKGTNDLPGVGGTELNPWNYLSAAPVHNPKSYDLWVDLLIGKEVYRVCNWGNKVIKLQD